MKIKENNKLEKNSNPGEIYLPKRNAWNTRRKYNYKYITTVF